ncbi:MAG TPA: c-type cytochrome biogenesis protein CcmI [Stellaceae bacterium]|nr:c-type cytochrome biogenesis protein CcmI [Stellaceae bacterium]
MITFWVIAGLLVVTALIALLRPLVRGAAVDADQRDPVPAMFRQQLAQIDSEVGQGRLTAEEAATAHAEITRRLLAAADEPTEISTPVTGVRELSWRIGTAIGIAALLPGAALAIYVAVGRPAALAPAGAAAATGNAGPHNRAELAAAADQLKARLQEQPGHVEGWILLAHTFVSLERFADARDAYDHAIALAPNEPRLHAELGELLVVAARGQVTSEAEAEFAKSGNDPRARFYGAEAALQRGDPGTAKTVLKALLSDAPADAPWRRAVEERLAEISAGGRPAGTGPTAGDVAAAQSMSPEQQQAMIRGMVDRLAARLEQNPNDKDGWMRLAHAYDVLGETEKAAAARARAAQVPVSEK